MKKLLVLICVTALMAACATSTVSTNTRTTSHAGVTPAASTTVDPRNVDNTTIRPMKRACEIVCYEKTPACYVTADKANCLTISSVRPTAAKESSICTLKSCDTKTTYNAAGAMTTTLPSKN